MGRARSASSRCSTAEAAHEHIQGSRLELFADAGHFPYRTNPRKFAALLRDFIETTEPAQAN